MFSEVIVALLKAGADLEARTETGFTPLHWAAAESKTPSVVSALLNAGADPKARDTANQTPWFYAQENESLKGTDAYWRLNDARFK